MNKILTSFILFFTFCNLAFGDCDFSKGITQGPNNTYIYTEACHLKVGQLVQQNSIQSQQLVDLNKSIQLKDLALTESDSRATLWNKTSSDLESRLQKVDSLESHNEWLYFGLGVATTFLAGYMAAKLVGH